MSIAEEFIKMVKEGRKFEDIYKTALEIGKSSPEHVAEILNILMFEHSMASNYFNELISFLSLEEFPSSVDTAMKILASDPKHDSAQEFISRTSLQSVKTLHPHLNTLYILNIDSSSYDVVFPWRESELVHFDFLNKAINDSNQSRSIRRKTYYCLLETRTNEAFQFQEQVHPQLWNNKPSEFKRDLHHVGFEKASEEYRQLYTAQCYHIIFSEEYRSLGNRPFWLQWLHHPTWYLPVTNEIPQVFGGPQDGDCLVCGHGLHRMINLDPIPEHLPISKVKRLTLATCFACIGWEVEPLYYQHDRDGQPTNIEYKGEKRVPITQYDPLLQTEVHLVDSGQRWRWQEHAMSNSRQNLHRVGGYPSWIQSADYLTCPLCNQTMQFILQLDDGLLDIRGDDMSGIFGDSGMLYAFWCDACIISGCFWQNY